MAHWDWEKNEQAGLHPSKLTCGSGKKAHWVCRCCPKGQLHSWTAVISDVALKKSGCPCCVGRQACECNSLQSLYPAIASEWDYSKSTGTPADYPASSSKKVWWHNSKRGSFLQSGNVRTRNKKAQGKLLVTYDACKVCSQTGAPLAGCTICWSTAAVAQGKHVRHLSLGPFV